MAVPSTEHLLTVWERGRAARRHADRAAAMLLADEPTGRRDSIVTLPIGERNRRLLSLRRNAFGAKIQAVTACPECGTALEFDIDVGDLDARARAEDGAAQPGVASSFEQDGYEIAFRLPDTLDLLALRDHDPDDVNRLRLAERIVLRVSHGAEDVAPADLPPALVDALDDHLSRADPHADIRLRLTCTECGTSWQAPFDITSYLWTELDAWALRALRDVHRLARAYGWREADILALSPARRRCYLDMLDE